MKYLPPKDAWAWLQDKQARCAATRLDGPLLVDVRMKTESLWVRRRSNLKSILWREYPDLTSNPAHFATAVKTESRAKDQPALLTWRSGKRSLGAGLALEVGGFTKVAHVARGFKGDPNNNVKRLSSSGWRHDQLPWGQM